MNVDMRMEEAADWLVRLQQDDVTEADVAAWLKWCAADKASLEAFERVQELYDQLQALPVAQREEFAKLGSVSAPRKATRESFGSTWLWLRERSYAQVSWSAAASLAVVVVAVLAWHRSPLLEARDYQAPRGTQQRLVLADRSHVTLASASEVVSNFTPATRLVELRKGEAFFEVQHDPKRPFVVRTDALTVTAVGTKFNVRRSGTRTVVAVTEGAVDVATEQSAVDRTSHAGSSGAEVAEPAIPVRLKAGQQAIRDSVHPGLVIIDVAPTSAADWRQGRLEYVMEPLSSVVDDVNRYATHRIEIKDAALGELVFTGTIFLDHVDDWAMTLPAAFPIATSATPKGEFTLRARTRENRDLR